MSDKEILEIEDFLEDGFNIIEEEIKDSIDKETEKNQKIFPLLAVRNIVLFPKVIMPITAGREKSIKLLQEAHKQGKLIAVVSQKNASEEEPTLSSLNTIGTLGKILKIINLPEGNITAIIKGVDRCKVKRC